jgi:Type ISP C-terminal specificity domain
VKGRNVHIKDRLEIRFTNVNEIYLCGFITLLVLDAGRCPSPFTFLMKTAATVVKNITDSALQQVRMHYGDDTIAKWDIFHYVYGLLHHPSWFIATAEPDAAGRPTTLTAAGPTCDLTKSQRRRRLPTPSWLAPGFFLQKEVRFSSPHDPPPHLVASRDRISTAARR